MYRDLSAIEIFVLPLSAVNLHTMGRFLLMFIIGVTLHLLGIAQDQVDHDLIKMIKKHGIEESRVMEIASWLTDVYGPRLTGSPMLDKATEWTVETLKEWGMTNVHLDEWGPFGRGWELQHFEMHVAEPSYFSVLAYPKAWSPSTSGPVEGEVIYLDAGTVEELKTYKGSLRGKFVLLDTIRQVNEWFKPPAERRDADDLLSLANKGIQASSNRRRRLPPSGASFSGALWDLLYDEGAIAVLDRSYKGDLGTVFVSGARASEKGPRDIDAKVVPQLTVSIEHYNRIFRILQKGLPVKIKLDLRTAFTNPDQMEHNIIAEIPGDDLADEVVMFGAHLDSWHAATGATDNAAGSAVMMEVARILLKTIEETGVKPRRTLRLALWTGEEQGLRGSRSYVQDHFTNVDPFDGPTEFSAAQQKISAYYNLDNGTGKVRGVFLQGNSQVSEIFRRWLEPFHDLDATTLSLSNTGGTDHLSFDAVGIPAFQFIQDPISYSTRTHHSNMDHWDHLVEEDLQQAATVIASFVLHTAMRDDRLPRKEQN